MPVFDVTVITGPYADGQLHVKKKEEFEIEASTYGIAGAMACLKFSTENKEFIEKHNYYVQAVKIQDRNQPETEQKVSGVVVEEQTTKRRGRPPKVKN